MHTMGTFQSTSMPDSKLKYKPLHDKFLNEFLSSFLASITQPTDNISKYNYTIFGNSNYSMTQNDQNLNSNTQMLDLYINDTNPNISISSSFSSTLAIILAGTLLSVVTTGGNLMVMIAFKLEKQLQTISNYFLFSLAMADLTIGVISIPLMTFYTARDGWELGYTLCQFWLCIDYLMSNASVMNLLLISFDRYFSVTRPLTYRPRRTSKKAMIMIASTFLISLALWPPLIIAWPYIEGAFKISDNECIVQFLKTNPVVTVGTSIVAFYGPVIIMIILYSRVYYVTRTRQRELVKLQAFHQKSIRRTISSNTDSRIPLRNTLSTTSSVAIGRQMSNYSKVQTTMTASSTGTGNGLDNDVDLAMLYCTAICENNRSQPNRKKSILRTLQKLENDRAKSWKFHSLFDHFNRPKPITSIPSTRQASLISSGFEDEESGTGTGDFETTTHGLGEEATPLKRNLYRGHDFVSPTQSDYGSTLASQFLNHVRQSFMIRKNKNSIIPTKRSRSLFTSRASESKLVQMASMLSKRRHERRRQVQQMKQENLSNTNNNANYDPKNSPIQEIRKLSIIKDNATKCARVTQSAPITDNIMGVEEINEESEPDTPKRCHSIGDQPNSVYTVVIQLGKSTVDNAPPAPPPPKMKRYLNRHKLNHRPTITLYQNEYAHLSPERGVSTGSSFSTADVSSTSAQSVILRRLSSCSTGAISDGTSPIRVNTPLIIGNRSMSHSSTSPSPAASTPVSNLKPTTATRALSIRNSITADNIKKTSTSTINTDHVIRATNTAANRSRRRKQRERRLQESKAARTLSAILLAFVITWAPYNVIVCMESFHEHSVPVFWFTFSYYLCYLNSAVNPFLYALCNATFRRTFWHIMTFKWATFKRHHNKRPHHQAAVALTAVAIAATSGTSRTQPFSANSSLK